MEFVIPIFAIVLFYGAYRLFKYFEAQAAARKAAESKAPLGTKGQGDKRLR